MSTRGSAATNSRVPVPRDRQNDYTPQAAEERRTFARERTGVELEHVGSFSFDPGALTGNIEQFIGERPPEGTQEKLEQIGRHRDGVSEPRALSCENG